jgi:ATP-binding cassette subfamily C (CFTR/MRP) protein 1
VDFALCTAVLITFAAQVSTSMYQYQNFRFTTRLKGGLTALIYQRTVQMRAVDAGEITAIALMGTDVERIIYGMQTFHEIWGPLLDIAIPSWLLGRQLFLACLTPIIIVVGKFGVFAK